MKNTDSYSNLNYKISKDLYYKLKKCESKRIEKDKNQYNDKIKSKVARNKRHNDRNKRHKIVKKTH